jgi:hypothetical protein
MKVKNLLVSHCLRSGSIASQLEQQLRKKYDVRTWGPSADEAQAIQSDIPYDTTDPADALATYAPEWKPNAYLWIESGVQFGVDLSKIPCRKGCILLNTDQNVVSHLQWARHFDIAFLIHPQYLRRFQNSGINAHCIPSELAEDPLSAINRILFESAI